MTEPLYPRPRIYEMASRQTRTASPSLCSRTACQGAFQRSPSPRHGSNSRYSLDALEYSTLVEMHCPENGKGFNYRDSQNEAESRYGFTRLWDSLSRLARPDHLSTVFGADGPDLISDTFCEPCTYLLALLNQRRAEPYQTLRVRRWRKSGGLRKLTSCVGLGVDASPGTRGCSWPGFDPGLVVLRQAKTLHLLEANLYTFPQVWTIARPRTERDEWHRVRCCDLGEQPGLLDAGWRHLRLPMRMGPPQTLPERFG